jgi:enoyl-CoA hydratase/carnithine racemase
MNTINIDYLYDNNLALISLNRPDNMNSINLEMVKELQHCFNQLEYDSKIWGVIITGSGEKAFSAGADLKERKNMSMEQVIEMRQESKRLIKQIINFKKPIIAAVNGYALAGGFEIALTADIIIASDNSVFGLTEVNFGIIPGGGGTQLLPLAVGPYKAKELIFTGRKISAKEAYELKLINMLTSIDNLKKDAIDMAISIAKNSPVAVYACKEAINLGLNVDTFTGISIEANVYKHCLNSDDRVEALKAFSEKREPKFKGK